MRSLLSLNPFRWLAVLCGLLLLLMWAWQVWLLLPGCTGQANCPVGLIQVNGWAASGFGTPGWGNAPGLWLLLLLTWLVVFGGRWTWLRWKTWQQHRACIDLPADVYQQRVGGWKHLAARQLGWLAAGLVLLVVHLPLLLWQVYGWPVWLVECIDLGLLLWLIGHRLWRAKAGRYPLFARRYKHRLLGCALIACLLSLAWLITQHWALMQQLLCVQNWECYGNYRLLGTGHQSTLPVLLSLILLGLQLLLWLMCVCQRLVLLPPLHTACPPGYRWLLHGLLFGLPAVWVVGDVLPANWRVVAELALAMLGLLHAPLLFGWWRTRPGDSLHERLDTSQALRVWLRHV